MYRDNPNISLIQSDDGHASNYIRSNGLNDNDLLKVGHDYWHPDAKNFEESFYLQHGVSVDLKWDNFYVERDKEREQKIMDQLGAEKDRYIFVHDDPSRDLHISEEQIHNPQGLPIIRPPKDLTGNIFDFCGLIENSNSAHFMDSSFGVMCDVMNLKSDDIYHHLTLANGKKRDEPYCTSRPRLRYKTIE